LPIVLLQPFAAIYRPFTRFCGEHGQCHHILP
jgi:hypothetical protein